MYHHILHATDLEENHFELCKKSADIAQQFNAQLSLIHVIQPPTTLQIAQGLGFAEFDSPLKDDAMAVLHVISEALDYPKEIQLIVEIGSTKQIILDMLDQGPYDLLIVGSHSPGPIPAFLGSVAYAVNHHAHCDILTLRAQVT